MTTIVTDGRSMAADSLSTCGDIVMGTGIQKLHRLTDGSVVGIAGQTRDALRAIAALTNGEEFDGEYTLLRLFADGAVLRYEGCTYGLNAEIPAAIGSGFELAIGAILAGASPKLAVEIAASRDIYTGGNVSVLRPRKPKR